MVTLKSSHFYTAHALKSFFKYTEFEADDEFLLIDNDKNKLEDLFLYKDVKVVENKNPLGFAENVNQAIDLALKKNKDLIFLNNDIIFTKNWLEPLKLNSEIISIPVSNQLFNYKSDCKKLILKTTMRFEDFNNNYDLLNKLVGKHKEKFKLKKSFQAPLMPFFCFRIPNKILKEIGRFDESFGKGGGEDVDYRIRCSKKGYEVNFILDSYLLHFHGKSTWDGGETINQIKERNKLYTKIFLEKWGKDMTQIFIIRKNFSEILNKKDLNEMFRKGQFGEVIRRLI